MQDKSPFYYKDYSPPKPAPNFWTGKICRSPKSIYSWLDKYCYGHSDYKRALSMLIWNAHNHMRPKGALLVVGNSGEGKTEMLRVVKTFYDNLEILDASLFTSQGYRGNNKITSGLKRLDVSPDGPMAICCIDEIDKLIQKADGGRNDSAPLWELLKIIEGGTVDVTENSNEEPNIIDTNDICFVLLGSFSYLQEKQSKTIGFARDDEAKPSKSVNPERVLEVLPPEIRGRIETICYLDPLTETDYRNLLMQNRHYNPIKRIADERHINLHVSKDKIAQIAREAYEDHSVRSINSKLSNYVNDVLFDEPDTKDIVIE